MTVSNMDLQVALHYGIPYTASILAFDPIQRLLAIGTLDGRIKIIGGDNIEGLLISPKKLPYKNLEFLHNQGFLVAVSNENDIQVWNLESRRLAYCVQWESNITAFAVIHGTYLMYVGDEKGLMSVLKFDAEEEKLLRLPYHIPANALTGAAGISLPNHQSIVGILPQPCTSGTRVLIAYENGLIILWDVSEGRVVIVRGYTDLHLKGEGSVDSLTGVGSINGDTSDHEQEEKEICSLCWVSNTGSVLAVGYINGDILLWNLSSNSTTKGHQTGMSSNNVVKLQLASGNRRLPVIILHWSAYSKSNDDNGGQLFIYGGDEMGSEEVLTVLTLEWSSGIETLRCISRVDLKLNGSFADMILIPNAGATENNPTAAIFVLTNPGQLNVHDGAMLSKLRSEEEKPSIHFEKFPVVVPTVEPNMTVTKLCLLPMAKDSSIALFKKVSAKRAGATHTLSSSTKWPLTGGVPSELSFSEDNGVERIYIGGYQDGSVRIWDATYPILKLMFVLEGKVEGIKVDSESASVSALDFCSISMSLAVGNGCGLVRVYRLHGSTDESSFHFVSETKHEVHVVHEGKGFNCIAAFSILSSPIRTLQFANSGGKLAAGFESGQVAMFDMSSLSVLFQTECGFGSNSPVISIAMHAIPQISVLINSPKHLSPPSTKDPAEGVMFILTKNAHVTTIDSITGNMISTRPLHPKKESAAISMYVIDGRDAVSEVASEKNCQHLLHGNPLESKPEQSNYPSGSKTKEVEQQCSSDTSYAGEVLSDPLLLLCCEDALRLYSLKSVIKGDNSVIRKVNLVKHCCWSTTFRKRDEKVCGLILLYQTGILEIRSLPDLELVAESSLMSILRWSFKTNLDKTMSSYDNGQIALVNGCELAFISLLACENDFRIPESLPCLHDKVLAAAANAAINLPTYQKKKQGTAPGILGGIIKGLKGGKAENTVDVSGSISQLEGFFSRIPFLEPSKTTIGDQEVDDLSIDDIEIDEVLPTASTSSHGNNNRRDEKMEREKLFQGSTIDVKPRLRTPEEILTQYKFAGDASAAAAHARDKLTQRQEKLQRVSERTEELQNRAEDFASMANELVKTMENKKWWKI